MNLLPKYPKKSILASEKPGEITSDQAGLTQSNLTVPAQHSSSSSLKEFSSKIERECIDGSEIEKAHVWDWRDNAIVNPLNYWERMAWGEFKPNPPRQTPDDPSKIFKYESLLRVAKRLTCLEISSQPNYSQTVLYNLTMPILLEGAKHAGCALTAGLAAISLSRIWNGFRSRDAQKNLIAPHLITPESEIFVHPERQFVFAFDHETKLKTCKAVKAAKQAISRLLRAKGFYQSCQFRNPKHKPDHRSVAILWSLAKLTALPTSAFRGMA